MPIRVSAEMLHGTVFDGFSTGSFPLMACQIFKTYGISRRVRTHKNNVLTSRPRSTTSYLISSSSSQQRIPVQQWRSTKTSRYLPMASIIGAPVAVRLRRTGPLHPSLSTTSDTYQNSFTYPLSGLPCAFSTSLQPCP